MERIKQTLLEVYNDYLKIYSKAQIYEVGEYFNNLRTSRWVFLYYNEIMYI